MRHTGDGLGIAATNKPVAVGGMSLARIANGQLVEAWDHWDKLAMLQQIGAIPALATKTAAG
jgi:predicted ester cyclase